MKLRIDKATVEQGLSSIEDELQLFRDRHGAMPSSIEMDQESADMYIRMAGAPDVVSAAKSAAARGIEWTGIPVHIADHV
jgi:hypothetical protein